MKLIFALGNPGDQYVNTRHNLGWQVIDALASQLEANFSHKSKFQAEVAEATIDGQKIILAKPTTFYNLAGVSARSLTDFYKISPSQVLVIHDDIDLPLGTVRLRSKGSDAGNNGIKSLNAHLGPDYTRLRVGAATPSNERQASADYVLSRLSSDEQATLEKMLPQILDMVNQFIADEHAATTYKLQSD